MAILLRKFYQEPHAFRKVQDQAMSNLDGWNIERCRTFLKARARLIGLNPRIRVRFDESDLVQDTLLKAADPKTPGCKGTTEAERLAWLEQIQSNLYIDRYRAEHADKRDVDREQQFHQALNESTIHWEAQVAAAGSSPSEQAIRNEHSVRLALAIHQLPADQRDVLLAREMLHLSMLETAEVVQKSVGAVAGLYRRGLTAVKAILLREDNDSGA